MTDTAPTTPKKTPSDKPRAVRYRTRSGYNGTRLIRLINTRAAQYGLTSKDVAKQLGMTNNFYLKMCNDPTMPAALSKDYVRAIARFLGVNVVAVYQCSGLISEDDYKVGTTYDEILEMFRRNIETDPEFSQYAPTSTLWKSIPLQARMLIASFYSRVRQETAQELMDQYIQKVKKTAVEKAPPKASAKPTTPTATTRKATPKETVKAPAKSATTRKATPRVPSKAPAKLVIAPSVASKRKETPARKKA